MNTLDVIEEELSKYVDSKKANFLQNFFKPIRTATAKGNALCSGMLSNSFSGSCAKNCFLVKLQQKLKNRRDNR